MDAGDFCAQRKPQPCAALSAGTGFIDPVKGLGNPLKGRTIHAASVIAHRQGKQMIGQFSFDMYRQDYLVSIIGNL